MFERLKRLRVAILSLLAVVVLATGGYVLIEGWSAFDSLWMTVITISTVGYSEVRPLSKAGREFTLAVIVAGRLAEACLIVMFTQMVVVEGLRHTGDRRRMKRELAHLRDHVIVCGWGRMGQVITTQLSLRKVPFVVIELNEGKCERLRDLGCLFIHGDASQDQVLRQAGVDRARGLIAVAPTDADNIFITLSARALNSRLFIVSRSIYEQDVRKLEIAGADRVISPYVMGARRIAAAVLSPAVVDFLDLEVDRNDLQWEMAEFRVSPTAPFSGCTIRDCRIRERTGCTILAVKRPDETRFISNPPPDTRLQPEDVMVVLGTGEQLDALRALSGARDGTPSPHRSAFPRSTEN